VSEASTESNDTQVQALNEREAALNEREEALNRRELALNEVEKQLNAREQQLDQLEAQLKGTPEKPTEEAPRKGHEFTFRNVSYKFADDAPQMLLIGGEANSIAPQKRPLSSMTPTLVMKDNKPWLVTGSPGGARIITTVLQSIVNTIDHKMNPAEAIVTPRVHHQWLPDELRIEEGLSPDTLSLLKAQGYNIKEKAPMGRVQIIQATENGFYGYSDPRNPEGKTVGY